MIGLVSQITLRQPFQVISVRVYDRFIFDKRLSRYTCERITLLLQRFRATCRLFDRSTEYKYSIHAGQRLLLCFSINFYDFTDQNDIPTHTPRLCKLFDLFESFRPTVKYYHSVCPLKSDVSKFFGRPNKTVRDIVT